MGDKARVLDAASPRIWTLPAGANVLQRLAVTLAEETGLADHPDALADAIVYLPNRRSARAFTAALHRAAGGGVLLPPDVRALGDLESDEAPPGAETALAGLGPALKPSTRLGQLARLVKRYYDLTYGADMPAASAVAAARDLTRLLDQAALSEAVDWTVLPGLAEDAEMAHHWKGTVEFLSIITDAWPHWLAENNFEEPFERRRRAADALAHDWAVRAPHAPVIIAGSTGATPASRILMKAATQLPLGRVVLPGLDRGADPSTWDGIRAAVSHPQNALIGALDHLGVLPETVAVWPGAEGDAPARARRRLVHEALAPADDTADWRATLAALADGEDQAVEAFATSALQGLTILQAPSETDEAMAAALMLRQALETPGQTAALVTPDASLARRISAQLRRWDVEVPPSGGVPLGRTDAGSLIGLCADWAADPSGPIALSAVMKHPFARETGDFDTLERHFLRGPRRWQDLWGLRSSIERRGEIDPYTSFTGVEQDAALAFVDRVIDLFERTGADFGDAAIRDGGAMCQAIAALAGEVSNSPLPWAGEDGLKASSLIEQASEIAACLGDMPPKALADLIHDISANTTVSAGDTDHPRLSIWGPLEARLQSADRIILAGLNEDVWPQRPGADAFLPRRFRADLGLNDPEDRLGLSAHDFAQLASAPDVTLLYSARRDDAPAVASRWVWRLQTLARGALGDGADAAFAPPEEANPLGWAAALGQRGRGDLPGFSAEPRPTRAPDHWPLRLSATRVDMLQRDPYAVWAQNVLKLEALDSLEGPLGANVRGTAVHAALEYLDEGAAAADADTLTNMIGQALMASGERPADWAARRAVWRETSDWYLRDWWTLRGVSGDHLKLEVKGEWTRNIAGAPFTLSAIADRVEVRSSGVTIVDYKTGSPPSDREIATGLSQQMPLQALIAAAGGYRGVAGASVEAIEYVAFKAKPSARVIASPRGADPLSAMDMAEQAQAGLETLITQYRAPGAPFLSAPRVQFVKYDYGYNRLARRDEWAGDTGSDAGGGDD